jgi:hypothetical protein
MGFVTFIKKRTATNNDCIIRLTRWMVSSLAVLLLPKHSRFITPATSNLTNPKVSVLTPIGSWILSTMTLSMTVVCSVTSFVMTAPQWRKNTLLGLGLSAFTPPLICCWRALSWISLSQMISHWILHLLILFSLTMVLQRLFLSRRWLTSFPSPRLISLLPILKTLFYLHSFPKTLKSLQAQQDVSQRLSWPTRWRVMICFQISCQQT